MAGRGSSGVTEDAARFLAGSLAGRAIVPGRPTRPAGTHLAAGSVDAARDDGRLVPGLGHPVHKVEDPRTPVLFDLARRHGTFGDHLALFAAIGRVHPAVLGRTLPLNGAGTCGAVLADLDLPVPVMRGVRPAGPLRRAARPPRRGAVDPIGIDVYLAVDRNIDYRPPVL